MKLGWDTPLPDEASQQWNSIRSNIIGFSKSIPRKALEKDRKAETWGSGYATLYSKIKGCTVENGTDHPKTRAAINLPWIKRRGIDHIKERSQVRESECIQRFYNCIVLGTHQQKTPSNTGSEDRFRNREDTNIKPVMFHHVPTDENAADCATRGVAKQEFAESNWWTGPKWLNYPCETWPVTHIDNLDRNTFEDVETLAVQSTEQEKADATWPVERNSNYSKLRRIVAYSLRFIRHSSKNTRLQLLDSGVQTMTPNAAEIELAEKCIIKQEQNIHGTSAAIQNKHFNVGYDNEGILKRFGRIQHADVLKEVANPMYIPRQSILGARIAENIHRSMAHCGSNQLVCELRQRFWIPKDKALCKKTVRNCVTCKKFTSAPFSYPDMGPLPKERVTRAHHSLTQESITWVP
ncbi:hypothetical protein ANCCAN_15637 [Ancylostoma caninum]|uniref:Integrase zinc-binding domain-containing protein n=1 Tax=Ancylostoma caninum TaxID=29170 RepID=A0A368G5X8_ANCCA|nr:hypothetical protein ANCCAN_15637 [Ancylostoma caninum]